VFLRIERESGKSVELARHHQLDALRGLAATVVVAYHIRRFYHYEDPTWYTAPVFSGRQAVIFFFVLSGYVLSLPNWRGQKTPYRHYLLRRFVRIYLPFVVAAVASMMLAANFCGRHLPLSAFYYEMWRVRVSPDIAMKQLLMWPEDWFNSAFWSLRYEMQMSILLPALCWVMRRVRPSMFTVALGAVVYLQPQWIHRLYWHFLDMSFEVMLLFALGAALAYYAEPLQRIFHRMGAWRWAVLTASTLLLCNYAEILSRGRMWEHIAERRNLFVGLGAAGVLLCSLHMAPFARLLRHAGLEYLGRISYSLYLTHLIAMMTLLNLLSGRIPVVCMVVLLAVASFAVAHMYWRLVEAPCTRLGQRTGVRNRTRTAVQETATDVLVEA
jgi:peptidoglycan/LPS O-acetylase OafA/YrhL